MTGETNSFTPRNPMPHTAGRWKALRSSMAAMAAVLAVVSVGCSAEGDGPMCDGGCHTMTRDGGTTDANTQRPTDLIALHLDPNTATVRITDADPHPTLTFSVTGEQRDHRTRRVDAVTFQLDNTLLASIDPHTGMLIATGLGGVGTVRASTLDGSGLTATAMVTFQVSRVVLGTGVSETDRAMFEAATPAEDNETTSPLIDYPLEGAVMPRNVHPPHVMWTVRHSAAGTDVYRVHLAREHATVDAYLSASDPSFRYDWETGDVFRSIADTDVGTPIEMRVAVVSGGMRRQSPARAFRTIDGVVAGSVYYWSPPQGRLMRIDVDTARRVDFLPNPPGGCIACHAVSRDGRRLIAVTEDGRPMTAYDLTTDLTASPPPSMWRNTSTSMLIGSFNGDGSRIVTTIHGGGDINVIDGHTGAAVTTAPIATGMDPEWSPDSQTIAFSRDNNLFVTTAMPGDMFSAPMQIHDGSMLPGGAVDWHPTFSPDSRWIVFQHGPATYTSGGSAALYAIAREGGNPVRLDRLNGGLLENDSFRPTFSPFNSGGYFWVLFTTSRDYGNANAGVRGHKLIWVAGFRNRPEGGLDPSEVPYYLDGQEPTTNLSPYWAPPPCRDNGSACGSGSECCSGTCEPDAAGAPMCRPPSGACRSRGASCGGGGDCCTGLVCNEAHICDIPEPL